MIIEGNVDQTEWKEAKSGNMYKRIKLNGEWFTNFSPTEPPPGTIVRCIADEEIYQGKKSYTIKEIEVMGQTIAKEVPIQQTAAPMPPQQPTIEPPMRREPDPRQVSITMQTFAKAWVDPGDSLDAFKDKLRNCLLASLEMEHHLEVYATNGRDAAKTSVLRLLSGPTNQVADIAKRAAEAEIEARREADFERKIAEANEQSQQHAAGDPGW